MKPFRKLIYIISANIVLTSAVSELQAQSAAAVSYQVFYDNLSPYGKWIQDTQYGYVWIPTVPAGFRPYFSNGYWVMTEYGSTWVSTYPWGWAPFHYGRWTHDDFYGWLWIPGYEWGPAWVVWRSGGDNIGWSPMQPGFRVEATLGPSYYTPADWWIFIPRTALLNPSFNKFYKGPGNNMNTLKTAGVLNKTDVSNGVIYVTGLRASEYARGANKQVSLYTIKSAGKPAKMVVAKDEITLYRPAVEVNNNANKPSPAKYARSEHALGKASAVSSRSGFQKPSTVSKGKTTAKKTTSQKKKPVASTKKKPATANK